MRTKREIIDEELYPAMFADIPELFPEHHFTKSGNKWISPLKLDATKPTHTRRDKTIIKDGVFCLLEQGGDAVNIITQYQRKHSLGTRDEAIEELCTKYGIKLPRSVSDEEYKKMEEQRVKLEEALSKMRTALYTANGADTLSYLQSRGDGYGEDFVNYGEFGYYYSELEQELRTIFAGETAFPSDLIEFPLMFPYRVGGAIKGFIFRSLNPDRKDKYRDIYISEEDKKRYHFFLLKTRYNKDSDITIVEGQIDALRASFNGVDNVVAASGGEVSEGAIKEAKKKGVKRVTLLYDLDSKPTEEESYQYAKIVRAITAIQAEGLSAYVCFFPEEPDGRKVDVDSYLQTHTGEELKELIHGALTGSYFLFQKVILPSFKRTPKNPKDIEDFINRVAELCGSPFTDLISRDYILQMASYETGGVIKESTLRELADRQREAQDTERQRESLKSLAKEIESLAEKGEVTDAVDSLRMKLREVEGMSDAGQFSHLLASQSRKSILDDMAEQPTGVATGFYFASPSEWAKDNPELEEFLLPSGALTIVAGQTSHGKSRMLENLALRVADNGEEGDVIYITFEESITAVRTQLINIFANIPLSHNNLRTLKAYYKNRNPKFISGVADWDTFLGKEEGYLRLEESNRIRLFGSDGKQEKSRDIGNDGTKLAKFIIYSAKNIKVKAVFIDYVQLMRYSDSKTFGRKDELREVCELLKDVAKGTGLPIVLAAQLNRQAASPIDMSCQNLADAADIEHSAHSVLLLWNSKVKPKGKEQTYYTSKGELTDEAQKLQGRGFNVGEGGQIYAILEKNRSGERSIDAILSFNGNTGRISQSPLKPQPKPEPQPKQEVIEVDRNISQTEEEELPF